MSEYVNFELLINASVFKNYLICLGILVIKMMLMSPLTTRQRMKHKAYISQEDAKYLGGTVSHSNPDVERVRSAHLNDMESIPIFLFAGFGYMCINPPAGLAIMLFRIFTACRILHTIVYAVVVVPQPARGLLWITGYFITGYMALQTIITAISVH